jgi:uncharacterized SAM-binding protein YcdF (DUF218 family)
MAVSGASWGRIMTKKRRKRKSKGAIRKNSVWKIVGRGISAAMLLGLLWSGYVQWKIQEVPVLSEGAATAVSADAGIVLGAALWHDQPSPGLKERLDRAVMLYRGKSVAKLIVSGGLDHNGSVLTEAEGMEKYLLGQGIPEKDILLENRARSTYENLLFSQSIMRQNGWARAVIVTHRFHAARALDIAEYIGMTDPTVSPVVSKALYVPWHRARETLAYAKWELDKLRLVIGNMEPLRPESPARIR